MSAQVALEGSQVGIFPAGPAGPRRGPFQACVPPLLCEGQAKCSSESLLGEYSGRFWKHQEAGRCGARLAGGPCSPRVFGRKGQASF